MSDSADDGSLMRAVPARGVSNDAAGLYRSYLNGARVGAWSQPFRFQYYAEAFDALSVDVNAIVSEKSLDELLPWDFVNVGVTKQYFKKEYNRAMQAQTTPSCTKQCNGCGLKQYGFCTETEGNRRCDGKQNER